jgi:hypothetical protein
MSSDSDDSTESSNSSSPSLPDELVERLSRLDESDLRAAISYAKSLLSPVPAVEDLLEERPGEEILEVENQDRHTKVVKMQPCAQGCDECPHGPYLYHVRVETYPSDGAEPSLHWDFLGLVR